MFGKKKNKSVSKISNGSNNMVFQNTTINNNIVLSDPLPALMMSKDYSAIQTLIQTKMQEVEQAHPLYPLFSPKWDSRLERLVSSAETEESLKRYPKRFEEKIQIDLSKYPGIHAGENIFEYSYRTQKSIEGVSLEHKEFLGDIEDPYPLIEYRDNSTICIQPPEFPPAFEAHLVSGESDVIVALRRIPSEKYGTIVLGNTSSGHGFDIQIEQDEQTRRFDFTIHVDSNTTMENVVLRERLLASMFETRKLSIIVNGDTLIEGGVDDNSANQPLLKYAKFRYEFSRALFEIEKICNCSFSTDILTIKKDDFELANIIFRSLSGNWYSVKMESYQMKCDFDRIHIEPDEQIEQLQQQNISFEAGVIGSIELLGKEFSASKLIHAFQGAQINNIKSVRKWVSKKKNNVLVSIKSAEKGKMFIRSTKLEDIKYISG